MKRILLLVCAASLALSALGQATPPGLQPAAIDPLTGLPVAQKSNEPRFDIEFPGGGSEDLVATIEKIIKTPPNIVIHPECRGGELPQFRLRDVTVSQIFTTLNTLAEPDYAQGIWRQVPMQDGEVWTLTKYNPRAFSGGYGGTGAPTTPAPPRACKIFNLTSYLEVVTVEDITTAVQGAWDLMRSESNPSIKYHKDTKLLIVVGSVADLAVVADVLEQLNTSVMEQRHKPAPGKAPKPEPPPAQKPTTNP